ncbi:hypothetical protein [Sediminibacillus massiliensis]|uniref:hypothetical protein n=1 Tax=Sediminibacillus massiliensis TaxID=1926277 RepID=UPI000988449A|nr:hypothetical protein [Sediminibacillus massiliensis]
MDLVEKQKARAVQERKTKLITELYLMDVDKTRDGRKLEDVSLFTLEHEYINAKCRLGRELA